MNKPTFRMSSAGKCPRALSAQLLGMEAEPIPEFVSRAAEEGNWHEERIKDKLIKDDFNVYDEQLVVTLEFPSFTLVGHIDGIVAIATEDAYVERETVSRQLLEIKTMSQFEFDRWMKGGFKAFPNYADQITCYMEATGLSECLYIVKNRSSGYEDRQVLTRKPSYISPIVEHLTEVVTYTKDNKLVPEILVSERFDPQSIECRRCEYKKLCIPEPKELTPIEEEELEEAALLWRGGKFMEAEAKRALDDAKKVFEQHTRATNILKWSFNKLAIQLVHYSESVTYPKAKLLKAFTEEQLEPASQVKEAFDQLRITDLEVEK